MRMMTFLVYGLLVTACNSNNDPHTSTSNAIPVLTAYPEKKEFFQYIETIGILKASVSAEIRPQVTGIISEVLVNQGQTVESGTPLFSVDAASYRLKLQEASAKLEMDRAALTAARKKLDRFRSLANKNLIAQIEWEELEATVDKAAANLEADQTVFDAALLDLNSCTLKACVGGHIGRLNVHPGQFVSSGQTQPLTVVSKLNPLQVEFFLTEQELSRLPLKESSQTFDLFSLYETNAIGSGAVSFMDHRFDEKSGLLLVQGTLDNKNYKLRPGQNVKIRMPIKNIPEALFIPQKAVKYNHQGSFVYVASEGDVAEAKYVVLGETQNNEILVINGLSSTDRVITDGHMRLYPGSKVDVKQ